MSVLVANCPRCKAKQITFDVKSEVLINIRYNWQHIFEVFSVCRQCSRSTIFVAHQTETNSKKVISSGLCNYLGSINDIVRINDFISTKDHAAIPPPEHLPIDIDTVFKEGSACVAVGCYNASAAMFRLCLDLSTKELLPNGEVDGLNKRIRRNLGLRLPWLFDNNLLPEALRDLSHCIKEDGNDGAHDGTLSKEDAEDVQEFTSLLLERLYTEPKKIELAAERRAARRQQA